MEQSSTMNQVLDHLGSIITRAEQGKKLWERECVRSFMAFSERLQAILEQLSSSYESSRELPAALITSLGGIEEELLRVEEALEVYTSKSRFFVLTHCYTLNKTMQDLTQSLGKWISLMALGGISESKDLRRKIEELSSDMQGVRYEVTPTEERSLEALEKELKREAGAGTLWRDVAGLIGVEAHSNSQALQEQVQLLRKEVVVLRKDSELQKMQNIIRLFERVNDEPQLTRMYSYKEPDEEEPLPAYDSFICPLTKLVMKDPVTVHSEITYERAGIEKWFRTCAEEGRAITCPVTGTVLASTHLESNRLMRQTIEQWSQRNSMIRIHKALAQLSGTPGWDDVEEALDGVLKVCEEGSLSQFKLGKSGFVSSVLELWKHKVPEGSQLRLKAMIILERIAADDPESQEALIQSGVLKAAVRSVSSSQSTEAESALKLLLMISRKPEHSELIGKEKGALIHLLGVASNSSSGSSTLSLLAEETLKNLEEVDSNVLEMAEAGRLEPLLTRLSNGPVETKVEMAKYLAERIFVNSQKEHVARKAGNVLVEMLSGSPRAKQASLGALLNLSMLEDNVPVLLKAGVLALVVDIIFSVPTSSNPLRGTLKEGAATTLSNIVSVPGSWETVKIDQEGNLMQSEYFLHTILGLLSSVGPDWNTKLLKILIGVASSPQAGDSAAKHIVSGNGAKILLMLLNEGAEEQSSILKLLSVISKKVGSDVRRAMVEANYLEKLKLIFKQKLGEESIFAGELLSNIPLTESELVNSIGLEMIGWCVGTLEELKARNFGSARVTSSFLEAVVGVLLQFSRSENREVLEALKRNRVMLQLKEALQLHQGQGLLKERAAAGLGFLSDRGLQDMKSSSSSAAGAKQQESWLRFFCGFQKPVENSYLCPLHNSPCRSEESFCLHEAGAVGLLLDLLEEEEQLSVQLAAVSALSTLVSDDSLVEAGVRELDKRGVRVITRWFQQLRKPSPEVQEKGIYLVERILRVREQAERCSLDQMLLKSLVEVFKHGNAAARKNAENALARTQMLSVVSGSGGGTR